MFSKLFSLVSLTCAVLVAASPTIISRSDEIVSIPLSKHVRDVSHLAARQFWRTAEEPRQNIEIVKEVANYRLSVGCT